MIENFGSWYSPDLDLEGISWLSGSYSRPYPSYRSQVTFTSERKDTQKMKVIIIDYYVRSLD